MNRLKNLLVALALLPAAAVAQKQNLVDGIIWVVGNEPILLSDVEEVRLSSQLEGTPIDNPHCTIPEQIAINKLFLHQAELDSVKVDESNVIRSADDFINSYIQAYGSREAVESAAGRKISQIRETRKKFIRESIMAEQVRSKLTSGVTATPAEVREYFKSMPEDSLPYVPTKVEVQIITTVPKVARTEVERIEERLREFARRVNSGESEFSTLAKFYSEDPGSARNGGELGFMGRNQLVPEFSAVAFGLNDTKKVSKIVRTEYGFHIMQLIEKRGDKVNVRHILLKPRIEDIEYAADLSRLDSIADDIRAGKFTFGAGAAALSDDKDTKNNNGIMANLTQEGVSSRFEMKDLPQDVAKVVDTLQVGQVSRAFRMQNAKGQELCAIVMLKSRIDGHHASMTEDFQTLRDVVLEKRRAEKVEQWIKEKIKSTYVRIAPEWRDCSFHYDGWVR